MSGVTVAQFAETLKVSVDRLLVQLEEAGVTAVKAAEDIISDDAKMELLNHLRRSHGQTADKLSVSPSKITLNRRDKSELRLSGAQGRSRTVNVEVRRKKSYIKRDVLEEEARKQQEELDAVQAAEEAKKQLIIDEQAAQEAAEQAKLLQAEQEQTELEANKEAERLKAETDTSTEH